MRRWELPICVEQVLLGSGAGFVDSGPGQLESLISGADILSRVVVIFEVTCLYI